MKNKPGLFLLHGLIAILITLLLIALPACSSGTPSTTSPAGTQSPAIKLVFTTQPSVAEAGVFFPAPVVVAAVDSNGNIVSGSRRLVTLTITGATGDSRITLFGGTTVTSVNGVFTFKELSINQAGTYTLTAKSEGLTFAISNPFDIIPVQGAKLVFNAKIAGTPAGSPFAIQPVVTVNDMYGNTSPGATVEVSLSLIAITPESYEAVLSGVTKIKAVSGVARFTGLSVDKIGTYVLMATSGSLGSAYSNTFDITPGAGVKLFFNTQPLTAAAGSPLTVMPPAIAVLVQDAYGNTTNDSSTEVTLTITPGTGSSGAVLSGVTKLKASNGVASFEGLTINKVGTGYTLTATASGLTSAVSAPFDITLPAPSSSGANAP
jgi:hypothetical protein